MANIESIEFVDCGSINIQYEATGKVTISLIVVKNSADTITGCYPPSLGGVTWDVSPMTVIQRPIIGSDNWYEWHMQFQGWGN